MNELNKRLFALLRSVLCNEEADSELLSGLDNEELTQLYKIAKKHDMAHIVAIALNKAGITVDGELAEKLEKQQMLAIYRYENLKYELDAISHVLDDSALPYIPLKGAVIRELYPEPWMRTSCDVDVLIHKEDLDRAVSLITDKLGYKRMEKAESHDVSLFSPSGIHLELHFCLKEDIAEADDILGEVWEYVEPDGKGGSGHILSPEFFIYYHIVHQLCHFLIGGCGIRSIYDLYLLRSKTSYDADAVLELCRSAGIEKFYFELCFLSDRWFSNSADAEVSNRLEDFVMDGGVYGTATNHYSVKRVAAGGNARYVSRRIFVPYDYLKIKYPTMKSRAQMPIYQVRRWLDAIGSGRIKRSLDEVKFTKGLEEKEIAQISALMKELDIEKYIT